jgi:drug/metabolite transporter (DMT)-like permease
VGVRRLRLPRDRTTWLRLTVAALVGNAIPYLLFAIGEQTVSPSLPALVGFAGALVILAPWNAPGTGSIGGALACLGAAASYGLSYVYMAASSPAAACHPRTRAPTVGIGCGDPAGQRLQARRHRACPHRMATCSPLPNVRLLSYS